ncbi:hypothetical protein SCHPADRAFT_886887 [Schizopora paradoxa]|uniref:Uncharacterized protein n=1 Tax=Schizopora paradoxa TaxID=27342 RepID=A0A0H2S7E1_9AGAM|nr:hypothetical protein SCHPADRAFT_886887 [Schizopora paradoxa]
MANLKVTFLSLLVAIQSGVTGKNDWSKACLYGACSFDIDESPASMGGTIEISGPVSAISDITSAAGWRILNCTDSTNSQTIRLACVDDSKGCAHVFQGGVEDTIVRLPIGCGSGPFVRVANHWISDDQSLPSDMNSKFITRDSPFPQVHMLQVDDVFENMTKVHGNVSFEINAQGDLKTGNNLSKRQNGSGFTNNSVTTNSQGVILFNETLNCPNMAIFPSMTGAIDLSSEYNITVSMNLRGTMNPPSITFLSFSAPTDATIQGSFSMTLPLQGTVNAIGEQIANMVLPSFLIDGIVTVNPSFAVTANAIGLVQLLTDFSGTIDFTVNVDNLQFTYPSNDPPATVSVSIPSAPFDGVALPGENSNAQFGLNAILQLVVEVSAFTQFVDLSVSHNIGFDFELDSTPALGNNEQVCIDMNNTFALQVSNSGPFFQVFGCANSQINFSNEQSIISDRLRQFLAARLQFFERKIVSVVLRLQRLRNLSFFSEETYHDGNV